MISAKPNILLIIADDVSKDAIPNFSEGNLKASMPNLQNLMARGITFNNLWSYSVCTPTRASIITGKYGFNTNVLQVDDPLDVSETSIQEYINNHTNNVYATGLIGKWHLSKNASDPLTMGVDYFSGFLGGGVNSYTSWSLIEDGTTTTTTNYVTTKLTDLGIDWISKQTQPWFLWMAYNAPHTPFHLAPTILHSQGDLRSDQTSIDENPLPYYLSSLEALDTEIGRLINTLSEEERAKTTIIFISDNGTPGQVAQSPYRRRTVKGSLNQGGINVPMIIAGSGVIRKGIIENALINTTDLYTTIGNIAGLTITEIYNSKSFYDIFSNESARQREYVYSEKEDAFTIRNATYKYIKFDNGLEELYNLLNDAYESTNLLNGSLTSEETLNKELLIAEVNKIRS